MPIWFACEYAVEPVILSFVNGHAGVFSLFISTDGIFIFVRTWGMAASKI